MSEPAEQNIARLLASAGLSPRHTSSRLKGGGNNQVYRVDADTGPVLLKAYFRHPSDPRDRLATEYSFCSFVWNAGVRTVPRPLAQDPEAGIGLYDFIEGSAVGSPDVSRAFVEQAVSFFHEINRHRMNSEGRALRNASEACFTILEHIERVDARVKRLASIDASSSDGREAQALANDRVIPAWSRIRDEVLNNAVSIGLNPAAPLQLEDRCLSPSDFGFHNTLCRNHTLTFIDFEYAGWDDPAKAVCDFFCQPDVKVPSDLFEEIARKFVAELSNPEFHLPRVRLLLPLIRLKWCCIMLNEFLPVDSQRRSFARDPVTQEQRRAAQLQKVRSALEAADLKMIGN